MKLIPKTPLALLLLGTTLGVWAQNNPPIQCECCTDVCYVVQAPPGSYTYTNVNISPGTNVCLGSSISAAPLGYRTYTTQITRGHWEVHTADCLPDSWFTNLSQTFWTTNWWVVSSPGYSASGPYNGGWISFQPTNCGSGTITFYGTFKDVAPCTTQPTYGGGTISISTNFYVANVQIVEPSKIVPANGTTAFTLTNTCGPVTWSVSPQQPGGPYANADGTIVAGTNCGSWTVTATSTVNTNCAASATLYVVNLTAITDGANPISSAYSNNVVIVGQAINLTAQTCGGTFSNFLWGVDPSTFSDYSPNDQTGMVVTYFPLTNSTVSFYWKDSGSKQVTVSTVCSNIPFSTSVTMSVLRPTAQITARTGNVGVNSLFGDLELVFGTPTTRGITNPFTLSMPSGYYNSGNTGYFTEWIQVFTSSVRRYQTNDGSWYRMQASGVLDTEYPDPYDFDDPDEPLIPGLLTVSASDSFDTTLMFRPIWGKWVPLRHVTWSWSGVATNGVRGWGLQTGGNTVNPPDQDTTTYPTWIGNWKDYLFQKEN